MLLQKTCESLFPEAYNDQGISKTNKFLSIAVLVCLLLFILETEQSLHSRYGAIFKVADWALACIFIIEYVARVWSSAALPAYQAPWGRIKYMLSPFAIIDLIAIVPVILTAGVYNANWLRVFRIARILKLAKLGDHGQTLKAVSQSISDRSFELMLCLVVASILVIISAFALYFIESEAQPEIFGSIPRALWWAIATLTTVGYGDAYPITALGKLCAAIVSLLGVAVVALPAGIFAAAFSDAFQAQSAQRNKHNKFTRTKSKEKL